MVRKASATTSSVPTTETMTLIVVVVEQSQPSGLVRSSQRSCFAGQIFSS
jgi:hypothetical protein